MPSKGDKVRVTIEGEYSHQGSHKTYQTASGWHILKVGPNDVAVPPDAEIEVTKRWVPAEPGPGVVVHNRESGNFWINEGMHLHPRNWRCISGFPDRMSWGGLLVTSNGGHSLKPYVPAELLT